MDYEPDEEEDEYIEIKNKLISYLLEPIVSRMKADGNECICV